MEFKIEYNFGVIRQTKMSLSNIEATTSEMVVLLDKLSLANPAVCPLLDEMRTEMNAIQPLLSNQFCVYRCANMLYASLDRAVIVTRYISKYNVAFGYNSALDNGLDSIAAEIKLLKINMAK